MNPDRYLRSFRILSLLVGKEDGLRLTQITDALGLPVSSVHNVLQTMVATDVLATSDDLHYRIGPRMIGVALSTVNALDIRTHARPHLTALARRIGQDVYLGLRMGRRVFYADRCTGSQQVSLNVELGAPLYLHSTATGKLFAAHDDELARQVLAGSLPRLTAYTVTDVRALSRSFERIRKEGFAASREETIDGIIGYAVPIRDESGRVAATVHVSVIGSRGSMPDEMSIIESAAQCARAIERELACAPAAGAPVPACTSRPFAN